MTEYAAYIQLLRELVRIPSPSFREDRAADFLQERLEGLGLKVLRYGNNLICPPKSLTGGARTIVLDAHIDTVPASDSYTRDPFDPGSEPDKVYGLGANDDGGSVVSMTAAFRHFFDRPLRYNLVLALTCQEERSGPDGAAMLYSPDGPLGGRGPLPRPDMVIVGEPTGLRMARCEKGLLVLDGLAKGVSAHAANGDGTNALYLALDDIAALRGHVFNRVSPVSGETSLSVTQITAGSVHNIIPDECRFTVDLRFTELYSPEELLSEVQDLCSRSVLTPRNLRNKASASCENSPLLRAAERLGIACFNSSTTSDWMKTDCDAVKIGPGESSRSHRADEFILTSEIEQGIEAYIRILNELNK